MSLCRLFETEGVAILTMLMSRYKVAIKEEPEFANETFEERKTRILNAKPGLTLTFVDTLLPLDIYHTDNVIFCGHTAQSACR